MMSAGTRPKKDGRDSSDYADYDMHIDNAMALNECISTLPSVYYFSVPCSKTAHRSDGTHKPKKGMEPLFAMRALQIGAYNGQTAGGVLLDESWHENDGLVNTISARAPIGAPAQPLDRKRILRGVWNVFPAVDGDHMWLQGGLMHKHNIRGFYLDLLKLIEDSDEIKR